MDTGVAFGNVFTTAVNELGLLFVFLLLGIVLLRVCEPLKKLYLPAGLVGGAIALVLGPQVLGIIDIPSTWSGMATPMINIVLTTTIFGTTVKEKTEVFFCRKKREHLLDQLRYRRMWQMDLRSSWLSYCSACF